MGEINVVPLVDIVMVLLIVFMVTAPLLTRGIDLSLPKTQSNTIKPAKRLVLTIGNDRNIYLDEEKISYEQLGGRLLSMKGAALYLRSDQHVPYGEVMHLIDLIKQSGINDVGLVTDLPVKEFPK